MEQQISAKGLRDLVLNYPYIFEVAEPDDIETPQQIARELKALQAAIRVQPPPEDAPAVCVMDSGIQEQHILLEPGIDKSTSRCFLPAVSPTDVADCVSGGGHGIVRSFPTLDLADVYAVISRYLADTEPFDRYLQDCEQEAEAVYRKLDAAGMLSRISKQELLVRARAKGLHP